MYNVNDHVIISLSDAPEFRAVIIAVNDAGTTNEHYIVKDRRDRTHIISKYRIVKLYEGE